MTLAKIKLDENCKMPLYHQLNEQIYELIQQGALKPGDILPSEREICDKYNISRGTVRQAIDILVNKGYVIRKRGKGTVIKHPVLNHDLIGDFSFGKGMIQQGLRVNSDILFAGGVSGKKRITNRLNLDNKEKLIRIWRVRRANDEPWIIEDSYMQESRFLGVDTYDLTSRLLSDVLSDFYQTRLTRMDAFIEPTLAQEKHSELLNIKEGAPALVLDRVLFDERDNPVVYSQAFVRGDRCRYCFKTNR